MKRSSTITAPPQGKARNSSRQRGENAGNLVRLEELRDSGPAPGKDGGAATGARKQVIEGGNRRQRLGPMEREIHDTVLQDLLYLSMSLSALEQQATDGVTSTDLAPLKQVSYQAYERLREIISGARSADAPSRCMTDVLTECVDAFNSKTGSRVKLETDGNNQPLVVSGSVAREAGLIIQEAISNAWRHSRAEDIRVVLSETADIIWVRVVDDGRGFDSSIVASGHYGLRNMEERANAIGARLRVSSSPGKGTRVNLYLPSDHSKTNIRRGGSA